ncbi:hypothetical protein NEUTE1DRAFT_102702 [Neurospora tetrasperma FGSC 2508]|uniref:Uncharacterized protein n=1 Tax=Neurospora tetrasperma (strain FGSC 2508 / ATCC MYA-4615 / P0657) TaxID=510951 RepID=F8MTD4_NEUT8|nr:uncharacterized protein NEUTE1DRAFT_102702 [Neurospora tetrasperma FGSC 2508]EGO55266.1 hypothetical protein NEUTE1DRAFT_102702 [Neurospora tetrasperma FGSC 2508]
MATLMRIYTPKRIGGKKQASRHKFPQTLTIHIHFGTDTCENFLTVGRPVARAKPFRNRITRLAYIASLNSMQTALGVPSSSCCHLRSQLTSLAFG